MTESDTALPDTDSFFAFAVVTPPIADFWSVACRLQTEASCLDLEVSLVRADESIPVSRFDGLTDQRRTMGLDAMSSYDRNAWERSIKILSAPPRRKILPEQIRARAVQAGNRAKAWGSELPGAEQFGEIVERALEGTLALTFQPALRSVSSDRLLGRYARKHPDVQEFDDIRRLLDLRDCDRMVPPRGTYTAASAALGGATALAVTGAEVASTVTAGTTAAVAVGAVAADAVLSMAMMGRTIGVVASRYGYDVRSPDEELFAMGVLSLGTASSLAGKAQALASLSRLTQQMMRHATWRQLNEHVLVRVIAKAYSLLGLRLTQKKLAQTIPVVGIGLNAALSAQLTDQTFRRAGAVYRLRFLSEKYGIDPAGWLRESHDSSAASPEDIVDVDELLQHEIIEALEDDADDEDDGR